MSDIIWVYPYATMISGGPTQQERVLSLLESSTKGVDSRMFVYIYKYVHIDFFRIL